MNDLLKNLHIFTGIAIKDTCTNLTVNTKEIPCYIAKNTYYYCRECIFDCTYTNSKPQEVIKIIGEHSERTD